MSDGSGRKLLGGNDPSPVERMLEGSRAPIALSCEHAGKDIPRSLGKLGLSDEYLESHIAWDIGAADLARLLANRLEAPLVLQRYSRLVIDCNRPPGVPASIIQVSAGVSIPGNRGLTTHDRQQRFEEIFAPYERAMISMLEENSRDAAFSIHSFTPVLGEEARPWDMGLLFRNDQDTSHSLYRLLLEREPDLVIGLNQPYQITDASDWFVPRHGERLGLPHALVEIRNDHIAGREGQEFWAALIGDVFTAFLETRERKEWNPI